MPTTRRSMGGDVLKPMSTNVQPATTPGSKVRHLKAELEKKDAENEALRANVQDLTSALEALELVKAVDPVNVPSSGDGDTKKKNKKDPNAPVPPKTAYKFFCELTPARENKLQVWKEIDDKTRQAFLQLAANDKERYQRELTAYSEEKKALEMYYEKKKQDHAMAFYEAHLVAQAALNKMEASKKHKKSEKDPDAPKRPTSSFMFFSLANRASVVKSYPNEKVTETTKRLASMWKNASTSTARKFEAMAAADRKRYKKEKEIYDAKLAEQKEEAIKDEVARLEQDKKEAMELFESTKRVASEITIQAGGDAVSVVSDASVQRKKTKKDPNAPKRAASAYNFFFAENRERIRSKMPTETTYGELMAEIGRQWKGLLENDKRQYKNMAEQDKVRYTNEMTKYNNDKEN